MPSPFAGMDPYLEDAGLWSDVHHNLISTIQTRLDLQAALDAAYDNASYDLEADYRREPNPPLSGKLAKWADQLLKSKGLR